MWIQFFNLVQVLSTFFRLISPSAVTSAVRNRLIRPCCFCFTEEHPPDFILKMEPLLINKKKLLLHATVLSLPLFLFPSCLPLHPSHPLSWMMLKITDYDFFFLLWTSSF